MNQERDNNKKMAHNCMIRIQSVYETLKSAEKRAADFMLNNPAIIADTNITEAAELAQCSDATLVRLARKLGFSGYPELKASIVDVEGNDNSGILYDELTPTDGPMEVVSKIFKTSVQSLMDTLSLMDEQQYLQALDYLLKADRILFAGAGDAYIVAYTGYLKFSRIGFNVSCTKDYDIQLIEASKMKADDVLVAISHTGRTQTVYEVVKCAKLYGAKVIFITNFPISPIAKQSDIVLLTAAFIPNTVGEIMTKRIPALCILETLYVNVMMRVGKEVSNTLANSNKAIERNKITRLSNPILSGKGRGRSASQGEFWRTARAKTDD